MKGARPVLAALVAALVLAPAAFAQAWPAKSVKIVVPFPPGGGADTLARIMAPHLAKTWGQPVLVENKPGASGHIGAEMVARSPADGYTLLMASTAALDEKNVKGFSPVTLVSASAYVIAANPRVLAGTASADANAVLALADVKEKLLGLGSEPSGNKPEEFAVFIREDQAKWAKLMNALGIVPQ